MNKPRAVFVTKYHLLKSKQGGSEERFWMLSTELARRGWDVHYISEMNDVPQPPVVDGVTLHGMPETDHPLHHNRPILRRMLAELKPDVVFNILFDLYTYEALRGSPAGTFRVWASAAEADGVLWPKMRLIRANFGALRYYGHFLHYFIPTWMACRGVRVADLVLAQHEGQQQTLNAVGIESMVLHNPHVIVPETEMQPHTGRPIILWAGAVKKWKRPEYFFELARRCRDLEADFVLIGAINEPQYKPLLERTVREVPNFRYDGAIPRPQVGEYFRKAHIFVSTSRSEGYPNTFIHSMMRGVPIVSLDVDPEGLLAKKGFGRLARDIDGLEKAVRELAGDAEKRREIGRRAREYAEREFEFQAIVDRLEGALRDRGVRMPEDQNQKAKSKKQK